MQIAITDKPASTKQEDPIKSYTAGKRAFISPVVKVIKMKTTTEKRPANLLSIFGWSSVYMRLIQTGIKLYSQTKCYTIQILEI
jgi:hypothetical protein